MGGSVAKRLSSIRTRLLLLVFVLAAMLFFSALYTHTTAGRIVDHSQDMVREQKAVSQILSRLSDSLHRAGIEIYQTALFGDDPLSQELDLRLHALRQQTREMSERDLSPSIQVHAQELQKALERLAVEANNLREVQLSVERRYPAMPILLQKLYPLNTDFLTALNVALEEGASIEQSDEDARAHRILMEVRYLWAQLISSVRVFVANRLSAFGPPDQAMQATENDRKVYADAVLQNLKKLAQMDEQGNLGLVQSDAVAKMLAISDEYETYFDVVAEMFYSDSWRGDQPVLQYGIDPLLERAWEEITRIQGLLNTQMEMSLQSFAEGTDFIAAMLWADLFVIGVLLLGGFFVFELSVRRPIMQVTDALYGEGRGEHYVTPALVETHETGELVQAFKDMRSQIRSRQARLEAVLDNAGEGILTINAKGIIESCNQACEILFGFSAGSLVGKHINLLFPMEMPAGLEKHPLLLHAQSPDSQHEVEMTACKANGLRFAASLRLGNVKLEGELLHTILVLDISEQKALVARLTQLAERDSLTGMYNRHFLMDELARVVERNSRGEHLTLSLLYIHLDNFKFVNDTAGHLAGDRVLIEVSQLLQHRARGSDLVARLGGDEFAVLLYDVNHKDVYKAADAYRQQFAAYLFRNEGRVIDVGCSIGVANLSPDITDKEELLARADLACHIAKRSGRNRVHVYTAEDRQSARDMSEEMGWARRIKQGLENENFIMARQPITRCSDDSIYGYEILLRMYDEQGDLVMPSWFLSSATRFGLSGEIDKWVIRQAIRYIAEHSADDVRYSINLSPKSIGDRQILKLIEQEQYNYGVNPDRICFEVTETDAMNCMRTAIDFLGELKAIGFCTALDDFGVGYSSFAYLKDLPVDYVKIDGSFVQGAVDDQVKQAIIRSMNEIAHTLNKQTVAEFVEDQETAVLLKAIGVDYLQGFHLGMPVVEHWQSPARAVN